MILDVSAICLVRLVGKGKIACRDDTKDWKLWSSRYRLVRLLILSALCLNVLVQCNSTSLHTTFRQDVDSCLGMSILRLVYLTKYESNTPLRGSDS